MSTFTDAELAILLTGSGEQESTSLPEKAIPYFRCPGCFAWTPHSQAIYIPPNVLDDWWDYNICPKCKQVIDHGHYEQVTHVLGNIGSYAGWSDDE